MLSRNEERAGLTFCSGFPLAVHIYADNTLYMHDIYQGMWSFVQVECAGMNVRLLCVDAGLESCLSTPIIYLQYFHEGWLAKHRTSVIALQNSSSLRCDDLPPPMVGGTELSLVTCNMGHSARGPLRANLNSIAMQDDTPPSIRPVTDRLESSALD